MRLIAGGYADGGAQGLYPLVLEAGALLVDAPLAPVVNVSAGVRIPGAGRWFVVDEHASRIMLLDSDDSWRPLASIASGGREPCHLALDPDARLLAAANYGSGTVALFRLDADGLPVAPPSLHQAQGGGPVAERQGGPHAHWVGFAPGGRLYSVDLGTDRVLRFPVDAAGTLPAPAIAYRAPPGSGPRQLAFHPGLPLALLVSELSSTLTVLRIEPDGTLTAKCIVSTLPAGAPSGSLCGAIALGRGGTRVYVSNRGHDSIATFALDEAGGVTLLGHVASGGRSPRFLLLAGESLLVAHEQAGGVTLLPLDGEGRPQAPVVAADVPGAAFLGVQA